LLLLLRLDSAAKLTERVDVSAVMDRAMMMTAIATDPARGCGKRAHIGNIAESAKIVDFCSALCTSFFNNKYQCVNNKLN
jgi:hypothetical protein